MQYGVKFNILDLGEVLRPFQAGGEEILSDWWIKLHDIKDYESQIIFWPIDHFVSASPLIAFVLANEKVESLIKHMRWEAYFFP